MRYRFIILSYNTGKDGKTAVTLRITKNRKRKYINTGLRASPGPRKDAQAISLHVLLLRHLIHRRRNAHKEQFGELQLRHIHSLQAKQDNGDYLLPIVSVPGYSGERLYSHIRGRYKHFSRNLNNLGLAIREYDYSTACGVCGSLLSLSQAVDIPSAVLLMKRTVPEFKSRNSPYEQYDLQVEREQQSTAQQTA